ncbi:MAG: AraC family transcriptional regulator [Victivallaceae bacterium]|jgi:AraC family transcriptional regulator of arabinose operon
MFFIKSPREEADFQSGQSAITKSGMRWRGKRPADWSLILALEGQGEIISDGVATCSDKGVLTLISPGHTQDFHAIADWDILWFHFLKRPHMPEKIILPERAPGICQIRLSNRHFLRASLVLHEAHTLDLERGRGWHSLAYNLLENVLIRAGILAEQNEIQISPGIVRAQKILANTKKSPDMNKLAASCGMSRSSFYSLFKQVCGVSPRDYREIIALRRAQSLLENPGISVSETATRTGFPNIYYFSLRFKKFAGMSPTAYRAKRALDKA